MTMELFKKTQSSLRGGQWDVWLYTIDQQDLAGCAVCEFILFLRIPMSLFLKCCQYFLLLFVCQTILGACTGEYCVYREFSLLEKLFGQLFWKNNYSVQYRY